MTRFNERAYLGLAAVRGGRVVPPIGGRSADGTLAANKLSSTAGRVASRRERRARLRSVVHGPGNMQPTGGKHQPSYHCPVISRNSA